ncbi:MAG: hypothetical protein WDW36_000587 [Sanguina aurantia]
MRKCQVDDALRQVVDSLQQPGGLLQDGEAVLQTSVEPTVPTANSKTTKQNAQSKGHPAAATSLTCVLDGEWLVEHARQVSASLPGGLDILGFYVSCPDKVYASIQQRLCCALADLAEVLKATDTGGALNELLLLHVDTSTQKATMRSLSGSSQVSALKPVEIKHAPILSNLVLLRCTTCSSWSHIASRVGASVPMSGLGCLKGVLLGVAVAHKRECVGRAIADLKADLVRSLGARVRIALDQATAQGEDLTEQADTHLPTSGNAGSGIAVPPAQRSLAPWCLDRLGLAQSGAISMPSRVLLPWKGAVMACDFLDAGETSEAAVERLELLVGLQECAAGQVRSV